MAEYTEEFEASLGRHVMKYAIIDDQQLSPGSPHKTATIVSDRRLGFRSCHNSPNISLEGLLGSDLHPHHLSVSKCPWGEDGSSSCCGLEMRQMPATQANGRPPVPGCSPEVCPGSTSLSVTRSIAGYKSTVRLYAPGPKQV
ncbi:unnamed protein product [Pleuronectes platessa]|uniref:Uncharacterized protein n=1 Tax=Pleuronectes platessa TaxID=8262 RepID=A0A9N7UGU4_PLEPL|nr:unnamed protein product [Pleuronectes platessa]